MVLELTSRGFQALFHEAYPPSSTGHEARLVQQSSAIGNYPDSLEKPGSSFLWVGEEHHLNREEVTELRDILTHWLKTGELAERISSNEVVDRPEQP